MIIKIRQFTINLQSIDEKMNHYLNLSEYEGNLNKIRFKSFETLI